MGLRAMILGAALLAAPVVLAAGCAQRSPETASQPESSASAAENAASRLRPPDTSSPRATMLGFIDTMDRAYRTLMDAHRHNMEATGIGTPESVRREAQEAQALLDRAGSYLNLSKIPTALQKEAAHQGAVQLKEILDRLELPSVQQIPDAEAVEPQSEEQPPSPLVRWRLPETEIVIARVTEGPREGEYLFSPQTVARLDEFYREVEELPYRSRASVSKGFYEFYISTPGSLLPPKWSRWLPGWSQRLFLARPVWQWMALVTLMLLWVLSVITSFRWFFARRAAASLAARYWKRAGFSLTTIATLFAVHLILREEMNITGPMLVYLRVALHPFWWALLAAAVFFLAKGTAEAIVASPKIDPAGIQASYYRAVFAVLGFLAAAAIFVYGLSRLGISLVPLLTTVGIGGLAIALAARPALEGVIGSFTIFSDAPYKLGERVKIMGHDGTIESIGLRSTRIRLLNGHVTSIPNDKMAAAEIENIGRRPNIRRLFNITITYDTPPDKIHRAVEILREILAVPADAEKASAQHSHPNDAINRPGLPPRVYFSEFNADSLNLIVIYWYHPPDDWWKYMEHAHSVNIQIVERFNTEGIEFAFPTQTVYVAGDDKRPLDLGRRAAAEDETL